MRMDLWQQHVLRRPKPEATVAVVAPDVDEALLVEGERVLLSTGNLRDFLAFKTFNQYYKIESQHCCMGGELGETKIGS
jgi:hypothetical protein